MCKKIFSLSIFFFACMMIVFSCCEAGKEEPTPAPKNPRSPVITIVGETALTYKVGETADALAITATVTDGGTLSYQWQKSDSADGEYSAIDGEDKEDFTPDTSAAGTTYYKCVVTNTLNGKTASAESKVFTVTVSKEDGPVQENPQSPEITTAGGTLAYKVGATADALTITATVTDGGTLSYQWQKSASADGEYTAVSGADKKDYTPDTSVEGTTYYKCVVTNTLNEKTASADSAIFTVTVIEAVEATPPEVSGTKEYTVEINKEETLAVTAKSLDGGELSYKWSKSSDNKTFEEMADEKASSLVITQKEVGTFYYKCVVTNSVEIDGETKTATSEIVITVTVSTGSGNIDIDFN